MPLASGGTCQPGVVGADRMGPRMYGRVHFTRGDKMSEFPPPSAPPPPPPPLPPPVTQTYPGYVQPVVAPAAAGVTGAAVGVLIGGAGLLVGSFLPWASVTSIFGHIDID